MSHLYKAGVIDGATLVSGRFAAWLLANLHERTRSRQPDDEIDGTIRNLTLAALAYRNGHSQAQRRLQPLPERPMTTQDVAATHGVSDRSVRRAIHAGRLAAELGPHGWEIDPADARDWRPRKVRCPDRAA